jgi:hypothetical protein
VKLRSVTEIRHRADEGGSVKLLCKLTAASWGAALGWRVSSYIIDPSDRGQCSNMAATLAEYARRLLALARAKSRPNYNT